MAYSLVLSSQTFCLLLYLFFFADLKLYIFCCCPFYKCSSTCLYSVWFWKHFHHDACDSFSCFALSTISYLKIRINYAVSVVLFDSIKFDFCFFWRISPFIRSRALPLRGNIDWYVHVRSYSLVLYSLHVWFTPIFLLIFSHYYSPPTLQCSNHHSEPGGSRWHLMAWFRTMTTNFCFEYTVFFRVFFASKVALVQSICTILCMLLFFVITG